MTLIPQHSSKWHIFKLHVPNSCWAQTAELASIHRSPWQLLRRGPPLLSMQTVTIYIIIYVSDTHTYFVNSQTATPLSNYIWYPQLHPKEQIKSRKQYVDCSHVAALRLWMWGQFEFRLWASSPRPKRHPSYVKKGYRPPAPASVGSLSNSLTKVKGMIQPTRGSGPINMNSLFLFNKTQQLT